jgi:hypothetical protein
MRRDGNWRLYEFDSFASYLDRAENPAYHLLPPVKCASSFGTSYHREAMHHARHGHQECLPDIELFRDALFSEISSQLPRPEYTFEKTGAQWDLDRVLTDDPDCWIHEEQTPEIHRHGRGNIIRMVINTASSDAVRSTSHIHRSGAILALGELLQRCGYHVQFEIATAIYVGEYRVEFRGIGKQAGDALYMGCLSYWTSSDMEMRIDFSICETLPEMVSGTGDYAHMRHAYGGPTGVHDRGDICFDRMSASDNVWQDRDKTIAWIKARLREQGIKFSNEV